MHTNIGLKDGHLLVWRIAVGIDGFGLLSFMCLYYGKNHFIKVSDFEEFKKTDIYADIIKNGPNLGPGQIKVVRIHL